MSRHMLRSARDVARAGAVWGRRIGQAGCMFNPHNRTDPSVCILCLYLVHGTLEEEGEAEGGEGGCLGASKHMCTLGREKLGMQIR